MPKFSCKYLKAEELDISDNLTKLVLADSEEEAYQTYLEEIGILQKEVKVSRELPSGLESAKIFNCDETGLYWRGV